MSNRSRPTRPDPELIRLLGWAVGTPSRRVDALGDQEDALRQLRLKFRANHQTLHEGMPPNAAASLASSLVAHPQNVQAISQCLLQLISNSSPATLRRECSAIVKPTVASLSNMMPVQANQTKSLPTVSYHLRILSTMIAKVGSGALIDLPTHVEHIRSCYQPPFPVQKSFLPDRSSAAGPQPPISEAGPEDPRNLVELNHSLNVEMDLLQTEHRVQLRLDALALLKSIAEVDAKALHPFWAQLLPAHGYPIHRAYTLVSIVESDPDFAVRIKACGVVKVMLADSGPYLAIAEENPTKVSFISLSAQIASITIELHHRLGAICKQESPADLTEALLDLCCVIVMRSAYQRISTPIVEELLEPIAKLLRHKDARVFTKARFTLKEIFNNTHSQRNLLMTCPIVKKVVDLACEQVSSETHNTDQTDWWLLLSACIGYLDFQTTGFQQILNIRPLFDNDPTSDALSTAKLSFLSALAAVFPGEEFDAIYLRWLRQRLGNGGLQSLADLASQTSEGLVGRASEGLRWDLVESLDDRVAVRLVGLIVSKRIGVHPAEWLVGVSKKILTDLEHAQQPDIADYKMNSTRSWTLANCAEKLIQDYNSRNNESAGLAFWLRIVALSQRLIQSPSQVDSQRTNGVRICGAGVSELLKMNPSRSNGELGSMLAVVKGGADTLCKSLTDRMPKVQWNAVASIRQIIIAAAECSSAISSSVVQLFICDLCNCLGSSESYKVRIQICLTLQIIPNLTASVIGVAQEALGKLNADMDSGKTAKKEAGHAQRLRFELNKVLQIGHEVCGSNG